MKRVAIHNYKTLYKGIAELGFLVKQQAQSGMPCDNAFRVLCLSFSPLIKKTISRLLKTRVPPKDLEQEVTSTLFEAVVAFDWNRCKDANFFNFFSSFVRQRLQFIPRYRIRKEQRELPKMPLVYEEYPIEEKESPHPEMDTMLKIVEQQLSPKHADMIFCLFTLRMTQEDTGKVLGLTQKGVNWLWKTSVPKLRKALKPS